MMCSPAFMGFVPDTVFMVVAIVFAAAGVTLGAWWIRGDRSRGRLRCQRCWYAMGDSQTEPPAFPAVCPECGRTHASIEHLSRTRRVRWGLPAVMLLVIFAAVSWVTPDIRRDGLVKWAPTWALATYCRVVPGGANYTVVEEIMDRAWSEQPMSHGMRAYALRSIAGRIVRCRGVWPAGRAMPIEFMYGPMRDAREAGADVEMVSSLAMSSEEIQASRTPLTPAPGVADPFAVRPMNSMYESADIFWRDPQARASWFTPRAETMTEPGSLSVALIALDRTDLETESENPSVQRVVVRVPLKLVPTAEEAIAADASPATDAAVRAHLTPRFYRSPFASGAMGLVMVSEDSKGLERGLALGVKIELLHEGTVVSTSYWQETPDRAYLDRAAPVRFNLSKDMEKRLAQAEASDPAWRIRIRGDAMTSLLRMDADRYWPGVIEVPLSETVK